MAEVKAVEWTPKRWWLVQVSDRDGSYFPLFGPTSTKELAEAEIEKRQTCPECSMLAVHVDDDGEAVCELCGWLGAEADLEGDRRVGFE